MPEFLFDGKAMLAALRSLADLLAARAVEHQTLIIVGGSSARMADGCKEKPIDQAIIGIVDSVDLT